MSKGISNLIILHSVAEGIWAGKFGGGCSEVLYLQGNDIFFAIKGALRLDSINIVKPGEEGIVNTR